MKPIFQLAGLVQTRQPSSQLAEAILSLLHNHPVALDIPYEFHQSQLTNPPSLNLASVPCLLPFIVTSLDSCSLCHNYLQHIHELAANMPSLLASLLKAGLYQTLFTMLAKLSENPGQSSDICGYFEADLLVEDINNFLRLIVSPSPSSPLVRV